MWEWIHGKTTVSINVLTEKNEDFIFPVSQVFPKLGNFALWMTFGGQNQGRLLLVPSG